MTPLTTPNNAFLCLHHYTALRINRPLNIVFATADEASKDQDENPAISQLVQEPPKRAILCPVFL
jgi:hypothetical protein